jgi:TLD
MRYSLIRDGASLDTFKTYLRGAKDIIVAIETTRGDVFGVFTSSSWRTCPTLFGSTPSFVWKMRYNRNFPCHSLIEQATLESEIDVYHFLEQGVHFQMCTHDRIGVGVGSMNRYDAVGNMIESEQEEEKRNGKNFGYAICLEDDLLSGTTSRSACYKSPCLVDAGSNGEPFEVLNLEAWTLTPAFSEESAENLEMTQYFVSESIRSTARSVQSLSSSDTFSSRDLDRHSFYRRVGHDDSHEELRDQWQLRGLLDGDGGGRRGMGASPRYSN